MNDIITSYYVFQHRILLKYFLIQHSSFNF